MSDKDSARWSRVLLKVSGEAFAGDAGYGIDGEIVTRIAKEIVDVRETFNVDIAVVVGGGNIWRGMRSEERRVGKECRSRWSPYH